MPLAECGAGSADPRQNHELLVTVGPSIQVVVTHHDDPNRAEDVEVKSKVVAALIDTGATMSMIDHALAIELELPVVDVQPIAGVAGPSDHDVYMAKVEIPSMDFFQYGRFTGVDLKAGGCLQAVLLGRTFLQHFLLVYDGNRAQVTLAR